MNKIVTNIFKGHGRLRGIVSIEGLYNAFNVLETYVINLFLTYKTHSEKQSESSV